MQVLHSQSKIRIGKFAIPYCHYVSNFLELREMGFSDGSASCNGCAGWSTNKGSHRMIIDQAIVALPTRKEGS